MLSRPYHDVVRVYIEYDKLLNIDDHDQKAVFAIQASCCSCGSSYYGRLSAVLLLFFSFINSLFYNIVLVLNIIDIL